MGRKEYRCVGFVIIEVHHGNCILTNTVCYCPWLRVVFKDVWWRFPQYQRVGCAHNLWHLDGGAFFPTQLNGLNIFWLNGFYWQSLGPHQPSMALIPKILWIYNEIPVASARKIQVACARSWYYAACARTCSHDPAVLHAIWIQPNATNMVNADTTPVRVAHLHILASEMRLEGQWCFMASCKRTCSWSITGAQQSQST